MSAASTPRAAAPDFTLPAAGGDSHGPSFTLSDFRKQLVVLYFYPKDSTPGCTTEAQAFRALHDEFRQVGCMVVGISRDTLKSHDSFRLKQDLPFPLLADTDETACQRYGVIKMKKLYGKDVRGIERSTFLIDRDGRIAREWRGVKVAGHAAEVLEAVRALR